MVVLFVGACLGVAYRYFEIKYQERASHASENAKILEKTKAETEAYKAGLEIIKGDIQRLRVTQDSVRARAIELARSLSVTANAVSSQVTSSSLVIQHPATSKSTGLRIAVQGAPERLHKFFMMLESEYPSISSMSTTVTKKQGEIEIETIYLIPDYAAI